MSRGKELVNRWHESRGWGGKWESSDYDLAEMLDAALVEAYESGKHDKTTNNGRGPSGGEEFQVL